MATEDLSRSAFYGSKRYKGVRMQQGRVLTDDDYNEGQHIQEEDQRRARVDIIGPYGSPDGGFCINNPTVDKGKIDFEITAGTFYLGGLCLELLQAEPPETFQEQRDWLGNPGISAPNQERYDLVYLEAWQQPVSAVEDEELLEMALGGPDTSIRLRTMYRVKVEAGVSKTSCSEAWKDLCEDWSKQHFGELTDQNELEPNIRLVVGYEQEEIQAVDLCTPSVSGGYLGAENQAIRVQLLGLDKEGFNRLTWGFDNAAPLYRVQVKPGNSEVVMLTLPKDHAHWPVAGQVIEVLSWSARLANGELLAEELEFSEQSRHLCKVESSYDPDKGVFTLTEPLPKDFGKVWLSSKSAPTPPYYFLRVWDRGSDHESDAAIKPKKVAQGQEATLGHTGLKITLVGTDDRPGDYWNIAARPETPNQVVPWELEEGRRPHGIRRFRAPLGLIQWPAPNSNKLPVVLDKDCRKPFKPLTQCCANGTGPGPGTETQFCCSVTVGGGAGKFHTIQEAVNALCETGGGNLHPARRV